MSTISTPQHFTRNMHSLMLLPYTQTKCYFNERIKLFPDSHMLQRMLHACRRLSSTATLKRANSLYDRTLL